MATCPRCKGPLTDAHKCPYRPGLVVAETVLAGIAGGLAGLVLMAALDPRSEVTALDFIAIVFGACIGIGVDRFLRT